MKRVPKATEASVAKTVSPVKVAKTATQALEVELGPKVHAVYLVLQECYTL